MNDFLCIVGLFFAIVGVIALIIVGVEALGSPTVFTESLRADRAKARKALMDNGLAEYRISEDGKVKFYILGQEEEEEEKEGEEE